MTGFARVRKALPEGEVVLSLKSVNHRGLDIHFHLPSELDGMEGDLRNLLKSGVARGHLQVHVYLVQVAAASAPSVNHALLDSYFRAFREAAQRYQIAGQPDLNAALALPGMIGSAPNGELGEAVPAAVLEAAGE